MYVALDIETTGLDPETCQVLEIGMVADIRGMCVRDCPTFHAIIEPDGDIVGEPQALAMNAELLARIGRGDSTALDAVMKQLDRWLDSLSVSGPQVILLGKNVGSFDWQFVKRLKGFPSRRFSHRFMDVGSLYATADGMKSQAYLVKQAAQMYAIPGKEHEAVFDARVSLALARSAWGVGI